MELVIRFLIGGAVVSFFAMSASAFRPKSFAGLFAAAPSVALATITLTVLKKGTGYAAIEAQSMMLGAAAFLFYACLVSRLLFHGTLPVLPTTTIALVGWFTVALGLKLLI